MSLIVGIRVVPSFFLIPVFPRLYNFLFSRFCMFSLNDSSLVSSISTTKAIRERNYK